MTRPVEERIAHGDAAMVDYLTLDNIGNGYPERPKIAANDAGFERDLRAAMRELPAAVKRVVAAKLAGIRLAATIAAPAADDRKHAIQYILLHELAHVLAIGGRVHPSWAQAPASIGDPAAYPFFALSWRVAEGRYATRFDEGFPQRKEIVYYFGAKLDGAGMRPAYEWLERTDFATLYSATHPADDFAEAFANYVHVVMMKRPFEVRILEGGKLVKSYRPCWEQERCRRKREIVEGMLGP